MNQWTQLTLTRRDESITTTIDTYGHLLPVGDELISDIIDTVLRGGSIRPAPMMRLIKGGASAPSSGEDDAGSQA